jgi:putative sigma-54 modulation protein
MELKVTGKNIDLTADLNKYIQQKLGRLDRHLKKKIIEAKVEISEEKTRSPQQRFIAQVTINSNGTLLRAEERGDDLFKAIDKAAGVMERQVERYKGKRYAKKGNISFARSGTAEIGEAETGKVVKVKQFAVKLMAVDEATEQMELLGHDFFLFLNSDGGQLNLVYRRKDKNYGLIEPKID